MRPLREAHFGAAIGLPISLQPAAARPKDRVSGWSRALPGGPWEQKSAFEFPIVLEQMRLFYLSWPFEKMSQTVSAKLIAPRISQTPSAESAAAGKLPERTERILDEIFPLRCTTRP